MTVVFVQRQLTIQAPTIGQLKVTALDELWSKTMLSKPTWARLS